MPTVSLAVSSYNQLDLLKIALASATGQSRPYDEILVIDDASTDGSAAYLREWETQGDNRRVICLDRNVGLGEVRNISVREVRGDYMACLDGDDWQEPNAHEEIGAVLDRDAPDALVFRSRIYLDAEKRFVDKAHANPFFSPDVYRKGKLKTAQDRVGLFRIIPTVWQKAQRVSFLRDNDFHCAFRTFEDIVWHHQCILQARDIICMDTPLVNYRLHGGSILGSRSAAHMRLFDVLDASARLMEEAKADPQLMAASWRYQFNLMGNTLLNTQRIPEDLKSTFARRFLERCPRMQFDMDAREEEMLATVRDMAALEAV